MSARGHDSYRDDGAAYLLGALTDDERQAFERHLEDCAECREEIARLRPAADALPRSVEPLAAPRGLKATVMKAVREDARGDEQVTPVRPSLRERIGRLLPETTRISPVVGWASAAVLLVVGLGGGFGLARALDDGNQTRTIAAKVQSREIPHASGSLSVPNEGMEGAILHVSGMPELSGRVYQAWVRRGGEMVPQPTFEVGEDGGGAVAVPSDLSEADGVLVTREPRGGSRAPSERPILSVSLRPAS